MSERELLRLLAKAEDDFSALASLVRRSIFSLDSLRFFPEDRSFVMLLNRPYWEDDEAQRVLTGVHFGEVDRVKRRGLGGGKQGLHELLAIEWEQDALVFGKTTTGGNIYLRLAGGGDICLTVTSLAIHLRDMGLPWPAGRAPTGAEDEAYMGEASIDEEGANGG